MRAAALLLSLFGVVEARQATPTSELLRDWIAAVDHHHPGQEDPALTSICSWTDSELALMRAHLESFVDAPLRNNQPRQRRLSNLTGASVRMIRDAAKQRLGKDPAGFRRHAAMLHTDAALICPPPAADPPPSPAAEHFLGRTRQTTERRIEVRSVDAQFKDFAFNNLHWEVAMDMLDALPASPPDAFIARWYVAIGAHFLYQHRYADAQVHFDRARTLVPDDPSVLFIQARIHETLSAPPMQTFIRTATLSQGISIRGIDKAETELRKAESLLLRALAGDPSLTSARLRLGRVVMQLGRWQEGLAHVRRAASDTTDRRDLYYAHLFAGDAQLSLGNSAAARQSYEHALTLFPDAQAARFGLSASIRVNGEPDQAIAAILPTLTKPPDGRADDDPWWQYYDGHEDDVLALIDALRASFLEPPQ